MKRALFFVIVACSSNAPPPKPPAPPPRCANVADHLLELMTPTAQDAPAEQLDTMRRLFNDHCRDDKWTPEAQDCLLTAASLEEVGQRCGDKLTADQTMALGSAIEGQRSRSSPPSPSAPTADAGVASADAM